MIQLVKSKPRPKIGQCLRSWTYATLPSLYTVIQCDVTAGVLYIKYLFIIIKARGYLHQSSRVSRYTVDVLASNGVWSVW